MYGTNAKVAAGARPRVEQSEGDDDLLPLAWRLNREFNAPVGLLDPSGAWQVRHGAAVEGFPHGGVDLVARLTTLGLGPKRVVVWHPNRKGIGAGNDCTDGSGSEEVVWLGLPVPLPGREGGHLIALAGFAATASAPSAHLWGPACPEPALRAWGQSVVDHLLGEVVPQGGVTDSVVQGEGNERLLIARLIRRLRISDAPERFQALATNALRGALGVAAVAWIPSHLQEPATISGEVEGLRSNAYRALVPASNQGAVQIVNQVTGAPAPCFRAMWPSPPTARARPDGCSRSTHSTTARSPRVWSRCSSLWPRWSPPSKPTAGSTPT